MPKDDHLQINKLIDLFCSCLLLFALAPLSRKVILLIGTGWSLVKPFLNDREKKIVLFVLVLQVCVCEVII